MLKVATAARERSIDDIKRVFNVTNGITSSALITTQFRHEDDKFTIYRVEINYDKMYLGSVMI